MSYAGLLRHQVVIRRRFAVLDGFGDPTYTERGQPITELLPTDTVRCRIQPLTDREVAQLSQAGPVVASHRVFFGRVDVRSGDQFVPVPDDGRRFEVQGAPKDAGGQGHHLEVLAQLVSSANVEPS